MRLEPKITNSSSEGVSGVLSGENEFDSFHSSNKQSAIINTQIAGTSSSASNCDVHYQTSGAIKLPIKVTNITTSQQISDSLYQNSKSVPCNAHACLGSIMAQTVAATGWRNREEILDQASEFLEQYFIHMKKSDSSNLSQRLASIATEVERTGTYTLTRDELLFGAKTAWRNAPRCIGRIQWNKLDLQDARHVTNTSEMFSFLCNHIRMATNFGNLRSFITVFPQKVPNREDFRVWNSQLISYAGYQQSDGSVIGDPIRVEFTKICQRLGWNGKNGMFDVLPLVLSAPGEGVRIYEIPNDIVLRVKITHPKYESFKELDLEWYAIPAVADMQLDCGGLQFTACPFNGWYMGTEIGARDMCDPQRYNLTERIADKLGLDTSNPTTLWKDMALIQINIAVLYSYQKAGVTIMDHHSASDSFIKHMKAEYQQRGGCPADWVWIVPPISGSLTSVFHQEMVNYNLRPSYEYQEKAWKSHKWISSGSVKPKYRLISVSKAVIWTVRLMSKVFAKRIKATILYATETGKSMDFAHKLSKLINISFNVRIICMENYNINDLINESLILVVTSTFGSGEAPDNGKEFWKNLYNLNKDVIHLKQLKYGVFALGSSQYPSFCSFGKNIDKCLNELGATQLLPIGLGDDLKGQEISFKSWGQECYKSSCKSFDINVDNEDISIISLDDNPYDRTKVRITEAFVETNEHHLQHELARIHHKKIISCKIITRVRLQPKQSEKQTLLVRLSPSNPVSKSQFNYEPGDHLAIFPSNPKEVVNALIGHFNKNGYKDSDSHIQVQHMVDGKWEPDSRLAVCSLREALTQYLDITTPPKQKFLNYLSEMANDNWDSFRLKKLSDDIDDYEKWRSYNNPNMADILNQFPSLHMSPEFVLTQLPLLQPRYYSVSSSRKVTPDEVHLTMDLVCYQINDGVGPKRFGVCSSFIDRIPDSDIPCFLRSAPTFRLPANNKLPVIMIGAGSGIAPFRGFWLQRQADIQNGETCGKMFLFFGCRDSNENIYGPDLNALIRKGVLHEFYMAFSREKGQKRQYIQDQVFKQRALLYWLIIKENAHIYVCGHPLMADGVRKAFIRMYESDCKLVYKEAENQLTNLINEGRYHEDVFGINS